MMRNVLMNFCMGLNMECITSESLAHLQGGIRGEGILRRGRFEGLSTVES
jgi:hypothetical protein